MDDDPGHSVASLFGELAELSADGRAARLARIDVEHPSLGRDLRGLLAAEEAAGDFLGVLDAAAHGPAAHGALDEAPGDASRAAGSRMRLPEPGDRIGRYRVIRPLGRGGMATVWLAHDERLDRDVALKVLDLARHADVIAAQERFLVEAQTAAQLDDLHVVPLYDAGETEAGDYFIAMSYCSGGSLAARLAHAPLSVDGALVVARQLTAALVAAHARGVVHLDVKPANVLFDAHGAVRLADFGIARLVSAQAPRAGALLGTAAYLAPEQLRGDPVDHRADLWSLGVTLHEMLTGRRPFAGGSHAAVLHDVLVGDPAPPDPQHDLPAELASLLRALLAKRPADRPATAADVLATLERIQAAERERHAAAADARQVVLAAPLAPLVGREAELASAVSLLAATRLLTLTGPGGSGKTRMALELARRLAARYADGVHVVSLAALDRVDELATTIAHAVGARHDGPQEPIVALRRHLARAHALLLLDNFEHVAEAAPLVADLLAAAPRLTVLVTSRTPLRLYGERRLPVLPLGLPPTGAATAAAVGDADAVRLFVDRARAGDPAFALTDANAASVGAICRRLDGLPLAIELAAARVWLFPPPALAVRLAERTDLLRAESHGVSTRHRSLRDVLAWSAALLPAPEQALFRRLSLFVSGFSIEAAADVLPAPPDSVPGGASDAFAVIERLTTLCDSSLLVRRSDAGDEPRFHMLETVREYAQEQLRAAGDDAGARAAFRRSCLRLAELAAPHLRGPSQVAWLHRLEPEAGNLRAALDDALAADDLLVAVRLTIALQHFWLVEGGFLGDTIDRLVALDARIRAHEPSAVPADMHGQLLMAIGVLAGARGAPADVPHRWFAAALERFTRAGARGAIATTENHLAWSAQLLGAYADGMRYARAALARHAAAGNALGVATASANLGWICLMRGELAEADRHLGEALRIHRRREDARACAYALSFLGTVALHRGEGPRAVELQAEALHAGAPVNDRIFTPTVRARWILAAHQDLQPVRAAALLEDEIIPALREVGHAFSLGLALAVLGRVLTDEGALDAARRALDESLAVRLAANHASSVAESEALLSRLWLRRGDAGRARGLLRRSVDGRMRIGEPIGTIECLELGACIAHAASDARDAARDAARLLHGADAWRVRLGVARTARDQRGVDRLRATLDDWLRDDPGRDAPRDAPHASLAQLAASLRGPVAGA